MGLLITSGDIQQYKMQLFCLPHAGGDPSIFYSWQEQLPDIKVYIAYYPLCGTEQISDCLSYLDKLILDMKLCINKEFIIFGHSMGAILSYKLAAELEEYKIIPKCVLLSGSGSPFAVRKEETAMHLLSDNELIKFLQRQSNDISDEVLLKPYFKDVYLPKLRSDMKILGECIMSCQSNITKSLFCDIYAFGANEDQDSTESMLHTWSNLTKKSFYTKMFPGNHFYIKQYSDLLLQELNQISLKYRS